MLNEDEDEAVTPGRASTRGLVCSTERRATELLDTVAWHGDDGEHGYVKGAAGGASLCIMFKFHLNLK